MDVYKTKREYSAEVMKRADGRTFTEEDRDTILYELYKKQGSEALAKFIANRDLVQFRRLLPKDSSDSQALEHYFEIFEDANALDSLRLTRAYPQIATSEQLTPYVDLLNPQSDKFDMSKALGLLFPVARANYESHRYFHFTRPEYLFGEEGILKNGLIPRCGELNQTVEDRREIVCFSEGAEGLISMACNFSKTYDDVSSMFQGKSPSEIETIIQERFRSEARRKSAREVAQTSNFEEFMGDRIFLTFSADDIEIENESVKKTEEYGKISTGMEFADGSTSKAIPPHILKVCVLRNKQTGECTYSRDDIVKYMMLTHPVDTLHQGTPDHQKRRQEYYQDRAEEISSMADYEMEYMDLQEFYREFRSELDKYNPNSQSKKRSLDDDCPEAVEGSELSYRTGLINETTRAIRADLVREEEKEQNNDDPNIE